MDSQKASTSGYDGSGNVEHRNIVQVLCPIRNYHFDDACVYFTKVANNYLFIQHLVKLPTIQYDNTYNLKKMIEDQMLAHVTQLHEAQQKKKAEEQVVATMKEDVASVQAKASKVVDDTIVCGVIIDFTNTGVIEETLEASNTTITDEVEHNALKPVSK